MAHGIVRRLGGKEGLEVLRAREYCLRPDRFDERGRIANEKRREESVGHVAGASDHSGHVVRTPKPLCIGISPGYANAHHSAASAELP